jgi:hypothetical protein
MTYTDTERRRAAAWKSATATLPEPARAAAPYGAHGATAYDFCLPPEHAHLNLLPEVREQVLELFTGENIPWHAGVGAGPGNHLLSSQVQCVNALGQMIHQPHRLVRAFGDLLDIDEVLEIEPGRFLTFEYIGPTDFFGEAPDGRRRRGTHCTSVDAAFLHRAGDGLRELVLVEWKYTESYGLRRPDPAKDEVRWQRYGRAWAAPDSPVRTDLLPFELILDEPFYQLVRQQLLAHELEKAHASGADRVRLLHVLPAGNDAYQASLVRFEHRAVGATVSEVWKRMLVRPDRFVPVDSTMFLDEEVTSAEYLLRYGPTQGG